MSHLQQAHGYIWIFVILSFLPLFLCTQHHDPATVSASCFLYFEMHYNSANSNHSFQLRGTFPSLDNWNVAVDLKPLAERTGVYTTTLEVQLGEKYQFKALRDHQEWKLGGNDNIQINSCNSTLVNYPWFQQKEGRMVKLGPVWSEHFNNSREIAVYIPPVAVENTLATVDQILVMHDGQNLFFPEESFGGQPWYAQKTMDEMIFMGQAPNVAIVGVYNTALRMEEYTYSKDPDYSQGGGGDAYLDFLENKVLPLVATSFPQLQIYQSEASPQTFNRDALAILGSSLGGLISCYAGWTRSHVYSKAGCMSSSFWWNGEDFLHQILPQQSLPEYPLRLYIDSGNAPGEDGDGWQETLSVYKYIEALPSMKDTVGYHLQDGGQHNEYYWSLRFSIPISFLYGLKVE